ncbi:translation initiation factor IF-2-like [Panicum virgatum]|uniref:translation initiation factor IF-2-like n=1 Tax=Panicum virgatum TaxID=38727 RepID=UPI0019D5248B|nr:translation initiation factor IF-2-like [Panicum virgatum]
MPFSTYLILLDPRAGSAAVAALHPQAPARTPRPCARAPAASSEVEKTAVVGAAPAQAPESPPASRARWRGYLTTVAPPASSRPSGAGPARLSRPSRAGESGAERQRTGQARNGEAACELPRQFQRRRSVRAPSAAQARPGAAPFGVHARAPPRCSGSAPELSVLHRQRPSAAPRRAELAHAEPLLPDPPTLAGAVASRSPALRTRPLLPPALAPAAEPQHGGIRQHGGAERGRRSRGSGAEIVHVEVPWVTSLMWCANPFVFWIPKCPNPL